MYSAASEQALAQATAAVEGAAFDPQGAANQAVAASAQAYDQAEGLIDQAEAAFEGAINNPAAARDQATAAAKGALDKTMGAFTAAQAQLEAALAQFQTAYGPVIAQTQGCLTAMATDSKVLLQPYADEAMVNTQAALGEAQAAAADAAAYVGGIVEGATFAQTNLRSRKN